MFMPTGGASMYTSPIGSPLQAAPDSVARSTSRTWSSGTWWKAVAACVVVVVAVAGGKVVLDNMDRTHLQVPVAISGAQRIDDARFAPTIQSFQKWASDNGSTGQAGMYGYDGVPAFFFAALDYKGSRESTDAIFQSFVDGFASSGSQATIDVGSKRTDTLGETTFVCARMKGKPSGSICMWMDASIVGFVTALGQGIDAAHSLTAVVRTSVET